MVRRAALLAMLATALVAGTLHADPNPTAEAVFDEGVRLLGEGKVDEACATLDRAVELAGGKAVGGLLLLGDCRERQARPATAWALYRRAYAAAQALNDPRAGEARAAIDRLEPTLPRLVVRVAPALMGRADLAIVRGGEALPREAWGVALPVDPGAIVVTAEVPGRPPLRVELTVPGAPQTHAIDIVPWPGLAAEADGPPPLPPPPLAPAEPATFGALGVAGVVLGGLGLVGTGLGIGFSAHAKGRYDDALADPAHQCDAAGCNAQGIDAVESARTQGDVTTALTIASLALLATGGALVVVDLTDDPGPGASWRVGPGGISFAAAF